VAVVDLGGHVPGISRLESEFILQSNADIGRRSAGKMSTKSTMSTQLEIHPMAVAGSGTEIRNLAVFARAPSD
jgi:hypothetical protein